METMKGCRKIKNDADGFSLVEMAVVLVILGFVITALILPITAQREANFLRQTDNQLELAQKALIGFAQANGRLPCPALDGVGQPGEEQPLGEGMCNTAQSVADGYLPAATLGIAAGFALDGWGHRIRYAVTQTPSVSTPIVSAPFTTTNGMAAARMQNLTPTLKILDGVGGISMIDNAVAVVYSTGRDLNSGGADEDENLDGDNEFVSHDIQANGPNGEFDHRLVWISPYILYNAMIQAGQLP